MRKRPTNRLLAGLLLATSSVVFEPACGAAGGGGPTPSPTSATKPAGDEVPPGKPLPAESWKNQGTVVVFIMVDDKTKTQTLIPDNAYLWNGTAEVREIKWVFLHKDATIAFKEAKMPKVDCRPGPFATGGICSVKVPKSAKGAYPYSVTGHLPDGSELKPIDPDIEVDR